MLDAHADGKGLGLHRHAALLQHFERIARAVAGREHDVLCGQRVLPLGGAHAQRRDAAAVLLDIHNGVGKPNFAAAVDDLAAEILQHHI